MRSTAEEWIHLDHSGRRASRPCPDSDRVEDRLQLTEPLRLAVGHEDAHDLVVGEVEREDRPSPSCLNFARGIGLLDLGERDLEAAEALRSPGR